MSGETITPGWPARGRNRAENERSTGEVYRHSAPATIVRPAASSAVEPMTVERARSIMGAESATLSDGEMRQRIAAAGALAEIILAALAAETREEERAA